MTGSKGTTLLELLVGITCFSIIIVLVTGIFVSAISGKKQAKELSVLQDEARYIMDYISRDLRMRSDWDNINYNIDDFSTVKDATLGIDIDDSKKPYLATIKITLKKDDNELTLETKVSQRNYE